MSAVEAFRQCPLFKGFTDTGLKILAGIAEERIFPKGSTLFAENGPSESLFVISAGRVGISATAPGGTTVALGEAGAGTSLGELSLAAKGHRMCTATTLEPVLAFEIPHDAFQLLMAQKPQACAKLLLGVVSQFAQKAYENQENLKLLLGK